jgi:hypothetical protein
VVKQNFVEERTIYLERGQIINSGKTKKQYKYIHRLLSLLYTLAQAKNILWARPCPSFCLVFDHIVTKVALDRTVKITLGNIFATVT